MDKAIPVLDGTKCHVVGCSGTFKKIQDGYYSCSANSMHMAKWKPDSRTYVYVPISIKKITDIPDNMN
jgi:hypothetical protein